VNEVRGHRGSSSTGEHGDPNSASGDVHSNVGSYVVGALDPPEHAEFQAHLGSCESCRREVTEFSETAAELARLVEVPPPSGVRSAALSAIRKVRPLPPADPTPAQPATTPDEVAPLDEHPSVMPWSLALGVPPETPVASPPRANRVLAAIVILALLLCLALGAWVFVLLQERAADQATYAQQTELLTAPDSRLIKSTLSDVGLSYVVSKERNLILVTAENLPPPPAGRSYQLWVVAGEASTPAGMLRAGETVQQWFSAPLEDANALVITLEADGAVRPTSEPLSKVAI
jgi:hypothetical protein